MHLALTVMPLGHFVQLLLLRPLLLRLAESLSWISLRQPWLACRQLLPLLQLPLQWPGLSCLPRAQCRAASVWLELFQAARCTKRDSRW